MQELTTCAVHYTNGDIYLNIYHYISLVRFEAHIVLDRDAASNYVNYYGIIDSAGLKEWLTCAIKAETKRLDKGFKMHNNASDPYTAGRKWLQYITDEYKPYYWSYASGRYVINIHVASNATRHFMDYLRDVRESDGYMVSHIPDMDTAAVLSFLEEVEQCSE